jgi:hypothetical protein
MGSETGVLPVVNSAKFDSLDAGRSRRLKMTEHGFRHLSESRNRRGYLRWVFEARSDSISACWITMLTSNHIHLLVKDTGPAPRGEDDVREGLHASVGRM